jgi:TetR/AcrR family transcriptional regulator, copper-responsive repressor
MSRDGTENREEAHRRPGRPRSFDREATIDEATTCYWREGPYGVSLNEVCRQVGVSKPGIYREFGGEDGLLAAVIDRYREQVVLPLLDVLASDMPFGEVIQTMLAAQTAERDGPMGCLITEGRLGRHLLGPLAAQRLDAVSEEMRSAYEARYERAVADGQANGELDPAFAASYVDAQLGTLLMRLHRGDDPEMVRRHAWLAMQVLLAPDR